MPQRYKLRLGDGTVLVVDENGLNAWLVDERAMVQAAGGRWRPLKEVLAVRHAAAKYAGQHEPSPSPRSALPLVPPPPKPSKDKVPRAPAAPSWADVVEPAPIGVPTSVQALAEEPTGPEDEFPRPESTPEAGFPIFSSKPPDEDEAPLAPDSFSPSEPLGLSTSEPPDLQAWADEPAIHSTEPLPFQAPPDEEVAAIPPRPLDDEAPLPTPSWWNDSMEPFPVTARPSLLALADDPTPGDGYTGQVSTPDDELPAIPLKPLDDRDEVYAPAATGPGIYRDRHDDFVEEAPRGFVVDERLVRAVDALGAFLSRWLDRLERSYRRLRSTSLGAAARRGAAASSPSVPEEPHPSVGVRPGVQVLAEEPASPLAEVNWGGPIANEGPPVIRLKPLEGDRAPLRAAQNLLRRLGSKAAAWAGGLKGWGDRLARRHRPAPSGPSNEPVVSSTAFPAPREPLKAPPPISALPVLSLADFPEPMEAEDIYQGEGESFFPVAWLWTKRIVLISGLLAGGIVAALRWETWFPKAARMGGVAITEMEGYIRTREETERQQRALQEATEQLPHLAPETIRLVLSGSPSGVLDPPEAFQRACDGADRGLSALSPEEALELEALRSALLDTLSPAEGERARDYDDTRARRATFAFENRTALDLFARGARALPPESLERLQALLGKAVAAGLALPTAAGAAGKR